MLARLPALVLLAFAFLLIGGATGPTAAVSQSAPPDPSSQQPDWDPACYRNNEQIAAFLQATAANYPQIAQLSDAGFSWEGTRHLWLMRLGSAAYSGPRPTLFLLAGQHARDIAAPEMLMRYISYLTQNYGLDPDVTWLLDNRWVYLVPEVNPDGYFQVYANAFNWFKNTDRDDGCGDARNWGTDLNRNYPFHWNSGGASNNPCDSSYPGPSALSEPESAHLLTAFTESGAGLVVSLQAPGPAVLYPWGWTSSPAPDAAGLDTLGYALGRLNGTPRSAVHPYNTGGGSLITGILDDTLYGQYDVPALTLNIGSIVSPACATLDTLWAAQRPALLYASKAAGLSKDNTLSHAFGPEVTSLSASPSPGSVQVTGVLSANYGTVEGAVYSVDRPDPDGEGLPMSGNFGGGTANVWAQVDTSGLPNGLHLLLAQGRNDQQQWGLFSSAFFTVTGSLVTPTPQASAPPPTATSTFPPPTSTPLPPSATPTLTAQPSYTGTQSPTTIAATYFPSSTRTPTAVATHTPTATPTRTPTSTHTSTATPTGTRTHTATRTETGTPTPRPPNTATPLPCAYYSDVYPSQYFYRAVDWLTCRHIVSGYSDGTFRPWNTASRAQIVKMVVLGEGWPLAEPQQPTFSDVSPEDWCYSVVETAASHGIISGYGDGAFRPNNPVTRGQLSKIIVLARGWPLLNPPQPHFLDVPPGSTFYSHIETAQAHGVVSGYGDGTFHPGESALRGQLSKMLYIALTQP